MPATALRLMRSHDPGTPVSLRTVASGGETVGVETADWCRERLGVRLNEFYGQTEANLLIGNCCAWEARPGSMGLPYPGHEVRVVDGEVCARVDGDPVAFLGYWRNEEATAAKVRDGWLHTGDQAEQDEDGYVYFVGRDDDVISSAGHRIGPGPIEECLIRHPAVSLAAVIGIARREARRGRQGLRRRRTGGHRDRRALPRAPGVRARAALGVRVPARRRVRRRAADDGHREDPPRRAAAARPRGRRSR